MINSEYDHDDINVITSTLLTYQITINIKMYWFPLTL